MFSLKEESRRTKIILISVTVIFILLGIYATFKFGNDTLLGSLEAPDNDDVKFIRSGWNLYERGYYSYHYPENKSAFMMPGLPIVIAGCTAIFGKMGAITAVRIIQVLLQAVSLLLVFFIARKIFNNSIVSLLAFILNAIYLPNLWASQLILTETIFKTLLLLLIYVTMYAIETKKVFYYIIGGILLGVSSYFRPQVALLPVLVLIMWIINKKYTFFDMVKFASIVIVIFVAIIIYNLMPANIESNSYYVKVNEEMSAKIEGMEFKDNRLNITTSGDAIAYCVKSTRSTPTNNSICWKNIYNHSASISIYQHKKYYVWVKDTKNQISIPMSINTYKEN